MMKKTLIALVLAATTVSGSAMAWSPAGAGGTMTFGGTATPPGQTAVWEVLMGKAVTGLDMPIAKGTRVASMTTTAAIPVIGIRTITNTPFLGGPGLNPQVSFANAADFSKATDGITSLKLDIKHDTKKIGTITMPLFTAAIGSVNPSGAGDSSIGAASYGSMFSTDSTTAFFGGLPASKSGIAGTSEAVAKLNSLLPAYAENFITQGSPLWSEAVNYNFNSTGYSISGYYGAGILPGSAVVINLLKDAGTGITNWTASLPVSVTYQ